jgi:hypothetical protein
MKEEKPDLVAWLAEIADYVPPRPDSRRFDELRDFDGVWSRGIDLLRFAMDRLAAASAAIGAPQPGHYLFRFPLGYSNALGFWNESDWDKLGIDFEPPSIHVIASSDFLPIDCEEYRRPLSLPLTHVLPMHAMYRCARSQHDLASDIREFYSDIFVLIDRPAP